MKNEKVENQKMEDVYNKEYLPSIVRVGRFVLLASTLFFFAPFLYTWIGWGVTPDWPAIVKGTFAWLLINLPWWISEPVGLFPGTGRHRHASSLTGGKMHPICVCPAPTAQKAAGWTRGPKRFADFTIAISQHALSALVYLAVAVFAGQAAYRLPASVSNGLSSLLLALFGCIFAHFCLK